VDPIVGERPGRGVWCGTSGRDVLQAELGVSFKTEVFVLSGDVMGEFSPLEEESVGAVRADVDVGLLAEGEVGEV
jgi:hypothetical protein